MKMSNNLQQNAIISRTRVQIKQEHDDEALYTAESCAGGDDESSAERQTLKIEQPDGAGGGNSSLLILSTLGSADASARQTDVAIAECGLRTCQLGGDMELPCLVPFAGDLDFSVTVADVDSVLQEQQQQLQLQQQQQHQQMSVGRTTGVKLSSYVYTPELDKVYVDMMSAVPFRLQCRRAANWPHRLPPLFVRCLPVYPNGHELREPVVRCPAHSMFSHPSNLNLTSTNQLPHLVRALHPHALYRQSTTCLRTRYSVLVPWPITLLNYQFACMNSCLGSVSRRRLVLLFQLEDAECRVYGRSTLNLKVCKSPKRDARHDLVIWWKRNPAMAPSSSPSSVPAAANPEPTVDLPLVSGFEAASSSHSFSTSDPERVFIQPLSTVVPNVCSSDAIQSSLSSYNCLTATSRVKRKHEDSECSSTSQQDSDPTNSLPLTLSSPAEPFGYQRPQLYLPVADSAEFKFLERVRDDLRRYNRERELHSTNG